MKVILNILMMAILTTPNSDMTDSGPTPKYLEEIQDNGARKATTLTITILRKPGFVWRGLVVKKMKKTVPEYKQVDGLTQKYYCLTADQKLFGGIYLWVSKKTAEDWFNMDWYTRVNEKYGGEAVVQFYEILSSRSFGKEASNEGRYLAALSYVSDDTKLDRSKDGTGLIRWIELKNDKGLRCFLSIWQNQKSAASFLDVYGITNEYFEVPLILNEE